MKIWASILPIRSPPGLWLAVLFSIATSPGVNWLSAAERPSLAIDNSPLTRETKAATSFAPIAKQAAPSVVNIFTTKRVSNVLPGELLPFFNDPFWRRFFGEEEPGRLQPRTRKERSLGSGIIVTKDGYILTNNHVVDGADEIKVTLTKDK